MGAGELRFLTARAKRLERALLMKNWTRVQLAKATGYDERTIRNIFGGRRVRPQTIIDVCQALEIEPELEHDHDYPETAAEHYGAYARAAFRAYEGAFFAYRRSFSTRARLMRTVFEMFWSQEQECLIFNEYSRFSKERKVVDHSQNGHVYISPLTDLIHLLTTRQGAVRLVTLAKMRGGESVLRGVVLTQSERVLFYQPSVSPIILTKIPNYEREVHNALAGPIEAPDGDYETYCAELDQTEAEVVQFAARVG